MRIDKIEATNFKNFDSLEEEFAPGVNLILGGNGSGKTGLLQIVNVALGSFFGNQPTKMQRLIDISEVKIFNKNNSPHREKFTKVKAYSSLIGKEWTRTFNSETKSNDEKEARPLSEYGSKILDSFYKDDVKLLAPIIEYYSTQRLFKDASQSAKQKYDVLIGRRNGYLQSLKEKSIKGTLVEWLGNAVTNRATKHIKEIEQTDLILENVDEAIQQTLLKFLDLDDNFSLKIYQEANFDYELFVFYDNTHNLPLSYYSDGFRNLIFLVMDLIWRASQLNPWLRLNEISNQVTGCVTIDEIDLHLHPKWQAKAVGLLQELLPKVQFFITTHSPTVVANFKERIGENGEHIDALYILENNEIQRIDGTVYGKDINSVLVNLMDAYIRPLEVLNLLKKFYSIAENPNSTEIEYTSLSEIANTLKQYLPGSDTEIIRINSILEQLNNPI